MEFSNMKRSCRSVAAFGRPMLFIAAWCVFVPMGSGCSGGGGDGAVGSARVRDQIREIITSARDRVYPALVHIQVITVNYWDGKEHKGRSVGSGTIIDKEGYVLTNQHVTAEGRKFRCTLSDKQEITATLVGEDPLTDLAVLKLELSEVKDVESLPVAKFGNSDEVQIGDYVMAMGSPFALSRTVTLGIVANNRRVFADGGSEDIEDMELEEVERFLIKKALARFDGNAMRAAAALGLSRSAFYRRLEKYGL